MFRSEAGAACGRNQMQRTSKQSNVRRRHGISALVAAGALLVSGTLMAEGTDIIMKSYQEAASPDIEWKDNKAVPAGMQIILIYGNPKEKGPYIFRARMPAGYKIPPHRHEDERIVTVLSGTYWSGAGEAFDQSKLTKFPPNSFYITSAGTPHFAWAETDVVIQEQGMGPVGNPIEYVNAADDPRKK